MSRDSGMMGTELAAEDLTDKEGLAVKLTNAGIVLAEEGDFAIGILAQGNTSGHAVAIVRRLEWLATYGASVTQGDALMSDADGKLVKRTSTNSIVGYALENGTVDEGHRITVAPQVMNTDNIFMSDIAAEDLTGKEGLAIKLTSTGLAVAEAGEFAIGILVSGDISTETVIIARRSEWSAIYGATVVKGAALMSDADGKLITRTATNAIVGYALEGGDADETHTITIQPQDVLA